jgi:NAD(P)-dependent dehydrogenase (short-subunit alcohol dehydrogenase family)
MITFPATLCIAAASAVARSPSEPIGAHATVLPVTVDLGGHVVLVTGAASGIGQATAVEVARGGGSVLALDRAADGLAVTSDRVRAAGGSIEISLGDVGDDTAVAAAVAQAVGAFGRLDGVVTCAGIFAPEDLQPLEDVTFDTFMHVLRVNLAGTFLAAKHAMPHLRRAEGEERSSIVTIASTAALRGHGFGVGYTASKGGVAAFTRIAAVQGGPNGVRANCICPGGVDTPMAGGAWDGADAKARMRKAVPLGGVAQPEEIASVATFLLSHEARHVTGQVIAVDGGATTL